MARGRSRWPPSPDQEVFTTGEVARICNVTIRTVIRWIDRGELPAYRIPGRRDRRVLRSDLLAFLEKHGLPLGPLADRPRVRRVLVVDDEPEILDMVAPALREIEGVEVHTAVNGYEAGTKTVALKPDVLLIDYNLGDVTGLDVARTVRQNPELKDIRIVCMSGYLDPEEMEALLERGIDDFVTKPLDLPALREKVERWLERGAARG